MTTAESYNEIMALEQHMDEYYQVQTLDPAKLPHDPTAYLGDRPVGPARRGSW